MKLKEFNLQFKQELKEYYNKNIFKNQINNQLNKKRKRNYINLINVVVKQLNLVLKFLLLFLLCLNKEGKFYNNFRKKLWKKYNNLIM